MFQAAVDGIIHEIEPDDTRPIENEQSSQLNKEVGKFCQKEKDALASMECVTKYDDLLQLVTQVNRLLSLCLPSNKM